MITVPERRSLSRQTADILLGELRKGAWRDKLPPERRLCEELQVSRTTLRKALAILRQKGVISAVSRRGNLINRSQCARRGSQTSDRTIGLLLGNTQGNGLPYGRWFIASVEHFLARRGYRLDVHLLRQSREGFLSRYLDDLVSRERKACWAICTAPEAVQKWFAAKKYPALVLGSCYAGIKLPELDVDYESVCRHAVLTLSRLGHRRIVYLTPERRYAGDLLAEHGFSDNAERLKLHAEIIRHDGTTAGICRVMNKHFGRKEPKATGIIVAKALAAITTAGWLTDRGFKIPGEISLICRDDNQVLDAYVPAIAHYRLDDNARARLCARILAGLAESGSYSTQATRIMTRFTPGGTLAEPAFVAG